MTDNLMRYQSDEYVTIPWFDDPVQVLTTSSDLQAYPPYANYIQLVKSGDQPVCKDIIDLIYILEKHLYPMLDAGKVYLDLSFCEDMRVIPAKAFPYSLYVWEEWLIPFICGFRFTDDHILVFNEYLLYMARGAGKNGFMSWIIYGLISKINGIPHYDTAVSASSERQAKTSFTDIYTVLKGADPDKRSFRRTKTEIESLSTRSIFQYLSSNGKTADGLRLGAMYLDEIHAIEDYAMMKVLRSSLGKIPDARMLITTTDGYIRGAVLDSYKDKGHAILSEEKGFWFPRDSVKFSGMLPFMHHIDDIKEAKEEIGWYKANPSLKYNPSLMQIYRQENIDMDSDPELNIEFYAKRLNYPKSDTRFALATHDQLVATQDGLTLDAFSDESGLTEVIGVVDYSESGDLTSTGIMMQKYSEREYYYKHQSFITQKMYSSGVIKPQVLTNANENGNLKIVYRDRIEPQEVANFFIQQAQKYYIRVIYIDQYKSTILKPELEKNGFKVIVIATNMKNETQILPVVDELFTERKIHAPKDTLFVWAVSNLYKNVLSKGIRFDKIEPKARKTDPASAFLAGLIGEYCYNETDLDNLEFTGKILN